MFDFGWAELLIVGAIALFVIVPQDIPKIAYQVGKAFRRIKYMQYALMGQFDDFMEKSEKKHDDPVEEPKEELDHDPYDEGEADAELMEMMPLPKTNIDDEIKVVAYNDDDFEHYQKHLSDCVVLSKDNKIVIQKRTKDWSCNPGGMNIFGGHVDAGETPFEAIKRELNEELGAIVNDADVITIGNVTEQSTDHKDMVHVYFWHDKAGTITGCYECEKVEFSTYEEAISQPTLMPYSVWALGECKKRGLLNL